MAEWAGHPWPFTPQDQLQEQLYFGDSPPLRLALRLIEEFGPTPFPVVLLGPTGCGKTVLARQIHERSLRKGEFVECSLAEVPDELRQTMLAGHARGAYTSAVDSRPGLIEQAHGGTLFLDELHLVSPDVQHYLLLVLDRPYTVRMRDTMKRYVDVRFVFATHHEPAELRRRGDWGEDFFFRIGFNYVRLPSLADRPNDILPLGTRLLGRFLLVAGKPWAPRFAPEVELLLLRHRWPGNIRELAMVCQYAAARLGADRPVRLAELPPGVFEPLDEPHRLEASALREDQVTAVLREVQGNKSEAARRLDISRQSLGRLLRRRERQSTNGAKGRPI